MADDAGPPILKPRHIDLQDKAPALGKDLEGLLNSKEQLRMLVFVIRDYARRFEIAQALCMRLVGHEGLCYLIDFDVIRNYLEIPSLEKMDGFVIDFLFMDSKAVFAIPAGAFEELLGYLASFARTKKSLASFNNTCGQEEAIRAIADTLSAEDVSQLSRGELVNEIESGLERGIVVMNRLLDLLTNPRFKGVMGEYDNGCYKAWLHAIEKSRRYGAKPRSKRDKRDAMNLAIASKELDLGDISQRATTGEQRTCYLLISQTRAVLSLIEYDEEHGGLKLIRDYFTADIIILRQNYPAIHPRDAMVLELLGGIKSPTNALIRIQKRAVDFAQLANHLQNQYIWAVQSPPQELYVQAFESLIMEERRGIREELRRISHDMLIMRPELRSLHKALGTATSEEAARERQLGNGTEEQPNLSIQARYDTFSNLFGHVVAAIDETIGLEYSVKLSRPDAPFSFSQLSIHSVVGDRCELESMIWGELYLCESPKGLTEQHQYFSIRWPIMCLEDKLIVALQNCLQVTHELNWTGESVPLEPVDEEHKYWTEGVVVSTPVGSYGMSLESAVGKGDWAMLDLSRLGSQVEHAVGEIRAPQKRRLLPSITQLRVNTRFGDIIYDVRVPEGMRERYLTVLSHCNIATQITDLYERTGMYFCNPCKLSEVLNNVLVRFPLFKGDQ
jgi:hypothetical protein